ncbi:GIY-YIG nuclease family protein [Nonomuraea sp. B19D2]|uniref:GIY-YIG nuclease family protein n=1 Tax=Nonomuraea sp. B19D2 TaxID=3159561 RepID=UPI0032DA0E9E
MSGNEGSEERPGCSACMWAELLYGPDEVDQAEHGCRSPRLTQCLEPSVGLRGTRRCTRRLYGSEAYCFQHERRHDHSDELVAAIRRMELGNVPILYSELFRRVLRDAKRELERDSQRPPAVAARRQREAGTSGSVVYFVEREGLIKIGTTENPRKRIADIGKGSSMPTGMTIGPVTLLATTPGGRNQEQAFHLLFADHRVEGEWFRDCKAIRRQIDDMNRAQQRLDGLLAHAEAVVA